MYTFQRTSGLIAFAFIAFHLYSYWWQKVAGKMDASQFYPALCADLSSTVGGVPLVGLFYLLGIAACAFHLANGLWGFCCSWGITLSRRAQRMSATVFGLAGIAIFLLGANTVIYFARPDPAWISASPSTSRGARTCADFAPAGAALSLSEKK
jgi:succinate dehydrogenase/fumarate reductase cytochrome b subunit